MTSIETTGNRHEQLPGPPRDSGPGDSSLLTGLVLACRPKQWLKNVLVLAAPVMAGIIMLPAALADTVLAFVAFCMAASGAYLVNDAFDVESDRRHPHKRHRPVASGVVPVPLAFAFGGTLVLGSVAVASLTQSWRLPAVLVGYLAVTTAYTVWLKHIAVVDLVGLAAGFVLRALAGAAATDVWVSDWFFIVAALGSLFMVAGKREAELRNQPEGETRATLKLYSHSYLEFVKAMSAGGAIITYCLWALDHVGAGSLLFTLSIVPFALGILRYAMLVDGGSGESPETLMLRDRSMQIFGLALAVLIAIGIYAI